MCTLCLVDFTMYVEMFIAICVLVVVRLASAILSLNHGTSGRLATRHGCRSACFSTSSDRTVLYSSTSSAASVAVGIEVNVDNAMSSRKYMLVYFRYMIDFRNALFNHVDNALDPEVIREKRWCFRGNDAVVLRPREGPGRWCDRRCVSAYGRIG